MYRVEIFMDDGTLTVYKINTINSVSELIEKYINTYNKKCSVIITKW